MVKFISVHIDVPKPSHFLIISKWLVICLLPKK